MNKHNAHELHKLEKKRKKRELKQKKFRDEIKRPITRNFIFGKNSPLIILFFLLIFIATLIFYKG